MLIPMLADFAVRLACGLAALLLATSWRDVPPAFFRTHVQVVLGLLVLSALDLTRARALGAAPGLVIAAAVLAYLAAIAWGLGLARVGVPLTALIVLATGGVLVGSSQAAGEGAWALNAAGRLASAFLLGATLSAMLLGHYYLTAPAMSIVPLRRFVALIGWALAVRAVVAALGLWYWSHGRGGLVAPSALPPLLLAVRWGMGVAGPALAAVLTWKTVQIRSTQSATGILYIAMTLVLFGELSALILSRDVGIIL